MQKRSTKQHEMNTKTNLKTRRGNFLFSSSPLLLFLFVSVFSLSSVVPLLGQGKQPDVARSMSAVLGAEGRVMWIDGSANLTRKIKVNGKEIDSDYTTTAAGVHDIVQKCKMAGINVLVVDIKPLSGEVLYASKIAPRMKQWKGRAVPEFDVLAAFVKEGHAAGLEVHAAINTLSEGHKYFGVGPAYKNPSWQSVVYTIDRGMIARNGARMSVKVPREPDDAAKPSLLTGEGTVLNREPNTGQIGLESVDSTTGIVTDAGKARLGVQTSIVLDGKGRVQGVIDGGLLGDDPLIAPEDGAIVTATRGADREWVARNVAPGDAVRFDMKTGRTPITQAPSEKVAAFVNVLNLEARKYEIDIAREIVTNYDVDGLVLDRCRHASFYNDFSETTRLAFEKYLGKTVARFPEDIFAFAEEPGKPPILGKHYKKWLEFRAKNIRDFVSDLAKAVRTAKPNILLGTYVGGWYPMYYEVGVNWGSERTNLRYSWFTDDYPTTGYADFFDWITTGCYQGTATREEARRLGQSERNTVEYTADMSNQAVASSAFVYAGLFVPDYADRPEMFLKALETASRQSQGFMIFDLTYIEQYGWWNLLAKAYPKPATPPHSYRELLPAFRSAMDKVTDR